LNRIVFVAETKVEAVSQPLLCTASMRVCARRMGRRRGAAAAVAMGSTKRMIELLTRSSRRRLALFRSGWKTSENWHLLACARQEVLYFSLHSFTHVPQLGVSQLIRGEGFCFFFFTFRRHTDRGKTFTSNGMI